MPTGDSGLLIGGRRRGAPVENLGLIRRMAASLLRQDPGKGSVKAKRLDAALDEEYMLRALGSGSGAAVA